MFVLRAIHGVHQGEYYDGFNPEKMSPNWVSSVELAEKVSGANAAGIIMAMIDGPCIVAVPERLASSKDSHCDEFAEFASQGMFQNPSDSIKSTIRGVIRDSAEEEIHEQRTDVPQTGSYMSVWEWLLRAMSAKGRLTDSL